MRIDKTFYTIYGYKIFTDIGWVDISNILKTYPMKLYAVYFNSGKYIECADNHCFIDIDNKEILAKDLLSGDILLSEDGVEIVYDVIDMKRKEEMYDVNLPYHYLYYANGILSHNSAFLSNVAARQVMHGWSPVLLTMEMAVDAFAQRFDSIFTGLDINRIYTIKKIRKEFIKKINEVKKTKGIGSLFIEQFPTGEATVLDFKRYLRELQMRNIRFDIIYVDYINLMKPSYKSRGDMYLDVKKVSEELRALSYDFNVPVFSVSQLNRDGSSVPLESLDFVYIAESMGIPATSDLLIIFGDDEDKRVYESEIFYKISKNRLGGRVGEIDKFFYDSRSLKMYDSMELDMWKNDAEMSGDERNLAEIKEEVPGRRRR